MGFTENSIFSGAHKKTPIYRGEFLKGGRGWLGQFADLRGGQCFRGGIDTPMHAIGKVRGMGDFKKWGNSSNGWMILKWGAGLIPLYRLWWIFNIWIDSSSLNMLSLLLLHLTEKVERANVLLQIYEILDILDLVCFTHLLE